MMEGLGSPAENLSTVTRGRRLPAGLVLVVLVATFAAFSSNNHSNTTEHGPPLYAYGTSYLADDTRNSPGRRYIEQVNDALRPAEFHNFGKNGATLEDVAAQVNATWSARRAIVVIDALTNSIVRTTNDTDEAVASAEQLFRSMLDRLGSEATIVIVKQGRLSAHDYALFHDQVSDETVDAWNAMVDRVGAGRPNVRIVDPNAWWDPDTMMIDFHPTDAGEDHIAQLVLRSLGLPATPAVHP